MNLTLILSHSSNESGGNIMQKFYSKKDWWVLGLVICMTGLLGELLLTMQAKGNITAYPIHTVTYVVTIFVIWWPIFNTRYLIDADTLTITCLFLKWKIKLSDIQSISSTTNSVSSPALSFDRLKIDYIKDGQTKFVLISPRNKQAFCQALQQHEQNISCQI